MLHTGPVSLHIPHHYDQVRYQEKIRSILTGCTVKQEYDLFFEGPNKKSSNNKDSVLESWQPLDKKCILYSILNSNKSKISWHPHGSRVITQTMNHIIFGSSPTLEASPSHSFLFITLELLSIEIKDFLFFFFLSTIPNDKPHEEEWSGGGGNCSSEKHWHEHFRRVIINCQVVMAAL